MGLLAKSDGESLYEHSIATYINGMKIISMLPCSREEREELKSLSSLPLLLHDIGKASIGFQNALKNSSNWGGRRHEIISASFLQEFNLKEEQIFAVITHHREIMYSNGKKTLPDNQIDQINGDTDVLKDMKIQFEANEEEIRILLKELFNYINMNYEINIRLKDGLGLKEMWLDGSVSSRYAQRTNISEEKRKLASKLRGIVKAADHVASSHYNLIDQVDMKKIQITKYPLRYFQKRCSQCDKSILLVAPTGSGKTEAVLLWAQNNHIENARLFYVLPYQASINAMHRRLVEVFNESKVGVLHSNTISYLYNLQGLEELKLECQNKAEILASLAREIYFPIRVCTPHQLLRFGLKGSGWEYLYLELQNSLIIYDEIHAFQPRIVGLTLAMAKLLKKFGAKIAFASATFPDFLKVLIKEKLGEMEEIAPAKEFISDKMCLEEFISDQEILNRKRHKIIVINGNLMSNVDIIKKEIIKGKKILVIANHVNTAQILYEELKFYKPMLLHSRFNKKDRREKEKTLISKEAQPNLVIATQVIEVSLDIDYDIMFTEPAPIDALSQRFGRINRTGLREPSDIFVLKEQVSKHNLYNKERTKKTLELLENILNPIGELDLVNITNSVYGKGYTEEEMAEFKLGYENDEIQQFENNLIAGVSREWIDDMLNKTDGSCEVLPINDLDEYQSLMKQGLWVEANELLINVRYNMINDNICNVWNKNEVEGRPFVVNCTYSSEKGLIIYEKPSNFDFD